MRDLKKKKQKESMLGKKYMGKETRVQLEGSIHAKWMQKLHVVWRRSQSRRDQKSLEKHVQN